MNADATVTVRYLPEALFRDLAKTFRAPAAARHVLAGGAVPIAGGGWYIARALVPIGSTPAEAEEIIARELLNKNTQDEADPYGPTIRCAGRDYRTGYVLICRPRPRERLRLGRRVRLLPARSRLM